MEPANDLVVNPITLLIERVFWISLGVFFVLTVITSIVRSIKEKTHKEKIVTSKDLEKLANRAIRKNKDKD